MTKTGSDGVQVTNGLSIPHASLPASFGFRADATNVAKVTFTLDGKANTENYAPWCCLGDQVPVGTLAVGNHVLTVVGFDGTGAAGTKITINFSIT